LLHSPNVVPTGYFNSSEASVKVTFCFRFFFVKDVAGGENDYLVDSLSCLRKFARDLLLKGKEEWHGVSERAMWLETL
jgi:hypothetical protein